VPVTANDREGRRTGPSREVCVGGPAVARRPSVDQADSPAIRSDIGAETSLDSSTPFSQLCVTMKSLR
jgi:hypothetical protein